jgi:hypothetical protein
MDWEAEGDFVVEGRQHRGIGVNAMWTSRGLRWIALVFRRTGSGHDMMARVDIRVDGTYCTGHRRSTPYLMI